jgi:hypothetical protein
LAYATYVHTKAEEFRAKSANDFLIGYPFVAEGIHLVEDGIIRHNARREVKVLHSDTMHIDGNKFLITLCKLL